MTVATTVDLHPPADDVREMVLAGLAAEPRTLPCKLLYDDRGSQLFEQICDLPEYYPTRTELAIMNRNVAAMARRIGPRAAVVEYGSGSSTKTPLLLEALHDPVAYIPIEISRAILDASAQSIAERFADVDVLPICADYTQPIDVPACSRPPARYAAYFPGSTIGNFEPAAAHRFLREIRRTVGDDGGLLIGVDLHKDTETLEAAYNDAAGVTAAFNLNLLERLNRELGGDFDVDGFEHRAVFNPDASRIEMHLVARRRQRVHVAGRSFTFAPDETIHTESSYKHHIHSFAELAERAGFGVQQVWLDDSALFSVQWLTAD